MNICPRATGRCMSRWRSMLSERWISLSKPSIHKNRKATVRPSQTPITTGGFAALKPNIPPSKAPTKLAPARTHMAKTTIAAITAPRPLLRAHWLRVRRHRSQRMVFSWSKFTSPLEPAQFVCLFFAGTDDVQKFVFQRSGLPQLFHSALMNELPVRDDAHVGTELFDDLQNMRGKEKSRTTPDA